MRHGARAHDSHVLPTIAFHVPLHPHPHADVFACGGPRRSVVPANRTRYLVALAVIAFARAAGETQVAVQLSKAPVAVLRDEEIRFHFVVDQ
jgi:hypothetical protein